MLFAPLGSWGVASVGSCACQSLVVGKSGRCKVRTLCFVDELLIGVLLHVSRKQRRVFHHVSHLDRMLARELWLLHCRRRGVFSRRGKFLIVACGAQTESS